VKISFLLFVLGILVFLNIFIWQEVFDWLFNPYLKVIFFNVGQGDAIFIVSPQKHQILIDGGPNSIILEKLAKEMPFWDRSIDLIILTHPEHDHIAGLLEVLKRYKVENILWTGVIRDTAEYKEWLRLIKRENSELRIAKAEQKIKAREVHFDILNPFENLSGRKIKNVNNTSVIAKLVFDKKSFLFSGDAYKSVERKLIARGLALDSDVLKVGHHGSKTSSAEEFIEKVLPEIAVISAGKNNRYGHPHQQTLDTLEKYGVETLRTDINGDIKIISDGKNIRIQ